MVMTTITNIKPTSNHTGVNVNYNQYLEDLDEGLSNNQYVQDCVIPFMVKMTAAYQNEDEDQLFAKHSLLSQFYISVLHL